MNANGGQAATRNSQGDISAALKLTLEELRLRIDELALGQEVLKILLPNGQPHDGETQLWDYKEKLPALPKQPSALDRKAFDAELGGLMKDAVAFHNAYGGYILFGVSDKGRNRIVGVTDEFDCGDFNARLQSHAGTSIECHCKVLPSSAVPEAPNVLLLLVPRRPVDSTPVRFQKDGPKKANGDRTFSKETYVRVRDQCRPATSSSEDWKFLHSDRSPPDRISRPNRSAVRSSLAKR